MITYHSHDSLKPVAEVAEGTIIICSATEMPDLLGEISYAGCSRVIIHSGSFRPEFYDLRTGVAGEILQKFSNYRMQLAILGDFSHLASKSWRDFIRESNRGRNVSFQSTIDEALSTLRK